VQRSGAGADIDYDLVGERDREIAERLLELIERHGSLFEPSQQRLELVVDVGRSLGVLFLGQAEVRRASFRSISAS